MGKRKNTDSTSPRSAKKPRRSPARKKSTKDSSKESEKASSPKIYQKMKDGVPASPKMILPREQVKTAKAQASRQEEKNKFWQERGFKVDEIEDPEFAEVVERRGWSILLQPPPQANATLVEEFYNSASSDLPNVPFQLRGTEVLVTAELINEEFRLHHQDAEFLEDGLERQTSSVCEAERDCLRRFNNPGKDSEEVAANELSISDALLLMFLRESIRPRAKGSRFEMKEKLFLLSLKAGLEINVGQFILSELQRRVNTLRGSRTQTYRYFPSLITRLMRKLGVEEKESDIVLQNLPAHGRKAERTLWKTRGGGPALCETAARMKEDYENKDREKIKQEKLLAAEKKQKLKGKVKDTNTTQETSAIPEDLKEFIKAEVRRVLKEELKTHGGLQKSPLGFGRFNAQETVSKPAPAVGVSPTRISFDKEDLEDSPIRKLSVRRKIHWEDDTDDRNMGLGVLDGFDPVVEQVVEKIMDEDELRHVRGKKKAVDIIRKGEKQGFARTDVHIAENVEVFDEETSSEEEIDILEQQRLFDEAAQAADKLVASSEAGEASSVINTEQLGEIGDVADVVNQVPFQLRRCTVELAVPAEMPNVSSAYHLPMRTFQRGARGIYFYQVPLEIELAFCIARGGGLLVIEMPSLVSRMLSGVDALAEIGAVWAQKRYPSHEVLLLVAIFLALSNFGNSTYTVPEGQQPKDQSGSDNEGSYEDDYSDFEDVLKEPEEIIRDDRGAPISGMGASMTSYLASTSAQFRALQAAVEESVSRELVVYTQPSSLPSPQGSPLRLGRRRRLLEPYEELEVEDLPMASADAVHDGVEPQTSLDTKVPKDNSEKGQRTKGRRTKQVAKKKRKVVPPVYKHHAEVNQSSEQALPSFCAEIGMCVQSKPRSRTEREATISARMTAMAEDDEDEEPAQPPPQQFQSEVPGMTEEEFQAQVEALKRYEAEFTSMSSLLSPEELAAQREEYERLQQQQSVGAKKRKVRRFRRSEFEENVTPFADLQKKLADKKKRRVENQIYRESIQNPEAAMDPIMASLADNIEGMYFDVNRGIFVKEEEIEFEDPPVAGPPPVDNPSQPSFVSPQSPSRASKKEVALEALKIKKLEKEAKQKKRTAEATRIVMQILEQEHGINWEKDLAFRRSRKAHEDQSPSSSD